MGWGHVIKAISGECRRETFAGSQQLTLGQLIERLESIPASYGDDGEPKVVYFDFAYFFPTTLHSWRGSYDEIAIGYGRSDYSKTKLRPPTVTELIATLRFGVGSTYEGYKGGEYRMTENTPIWVDEYGEGGSTGVVGILDLGYKVVIQTAHCEF